MSKIGDPGVFHSEAMAIRDGRTDRVWLSHDRDENVWKVEGEYACAEFEGKIPATACERAVREAVGCFARRVRDMLTQSAPEDLDAFIESLVKQDRAASGARAEPEAPSTGCHR